MSDHANYPISLPSSQSPLCEWERRLDELMPLFGHRNWIVVADSAYPAQSRAAIETIPTNEDQQTIVSAVLKRLHASEHVRPVVHLDQELSYVVESDASGVTAYREWLSTSLHAIHQQVRPHEEIITRLDKVAEFFRVLIIKSTMQIPYTTVFFELDCAYWNSGSESRLRAAMRA